MISCEKCIKSEEKNLGSCVQNSHEVLLQGVKVTGVIEYKSTYSKDEFKQTRENERIWGWNDKQMYGWFVCDTPETTDTEEACKRFRSSNLKVKTEILICAAEEQALELIRSNIKLIKQPYHLCKLQLADVRNFPKGSINGATIT